MKTLNVYEYINTARPTLRQKSKVYCNWLKRYMHTVTSIVPRPHLPVFQRVTDKLGRGLDTRMRTSAKGVTLAPRGVACE